MKGEYPIICMYIDEINIEEYIRQGWEVVYMKPYNYFGKPRGCFIASREKQ